MIITVATQAAALGDMLATGAAFDPAATFVGLYSAIVNNGQNTAFSDVTKCTGALATGLAVTAWTAPYRLVNGNMAADGHLLTWATAVLADAQSVAGWYMSTLAGAGALIAFQPINPPIAVPYPFGRISIVPRVVLTPAGITDASEVIDG